MREGDSAKEAPFVSVVIATFNRKALLFRCLESLLELDYPPERLEIVVVDDGSCDGTADLISRESKLKEGRIKYLRNAENRGAAASRNMGFSKACGELIVSLDDDCQVGKSWLKDLVGTFEDFPDASAVGGSVVNPTVSALAQASHILEFSSWLPLGGPRRVKDIPACNIGYRSSAVKGLVFPEEFRGAVYEDALFNHYLTRAGRAIIFNPKVSVKHYKWSQDFEKNDFYESQTRYAIGFLRGGFKVHGIWGELLIKYRFLNLLCLRLVLVFSRCLKSPVYLSQFIRHIGLIFGGEWHRGRIIYRGSD